ncbi:MAG: hypothetical protein KAV87_12855 [Desulfobacteraceae bacterium]|nr:hypothetical protein [Desulfobacteraceae bacterium]
MEKVNSENGDGYVRWKNLIPLIISIVVLGGGAGVYALNTNKEYFHPDAVRVREMEPLRSDIADLKEDVREVRKMLTQFLFKEK